MAASSPNEWIEIMEDELPTAAVHEFLYAGEGGGVCIFAGTTRRFTGEKETDRLFYEAHNSMALKEMRALVSRATETWPVLKAVLLHRTGEVAVGQASVIVGVTTPHRDDAFLASRFLIDEVKKAVQIWKKEVYRNGSTEWVETDWES